MKTLRFLGIFFLFFLSVPFPANADVWSLNGIHIYNNNSGDVGIGTTSPLAPLDVRGRQVYLGSIPMSIGYSGYDFPSIGYNVLFTGTNDAYIYKLNDYASWINFNMGGMRFRVAPHAPVAGASIQYDDAMVINQYGNVGIGVTNPQHKLSVNGSIYASEIKVTTNVTANEFKVNDREWSDFIFDKDYKLPSLDHVESYIKENKHLPDVPSAQDIKKNGLAMADMMAKQMQKIEELTLYVIELKKQNEELRKDNLIIKEKLAKNGF